MALLRPLLAALIGKMGGQVLINGHEAPLHVIRSIKGFVPQDDTVHEDLTVEENLFYSVRPLAGGLSGLFSDLDGDPACWQRAMTWHAPAWPS